LTIDLIVNVQCSLKFLIRYSPWQIDELKPFVVLAPAIDLSAVLNIVSYNYLCSERDCTFIKSHRPALGIDCLVYPVLGVKSAQRQQAVRGRQFSPHVTMKSKPNWGILVTVSKLKLGGSGI
jgi:hypothetical protein